MVADHCQIHRPPCVPYMLERRTFIAMLAGGLLAAPLAPCTQLTAKVPWIGHLSLPPSSATTHLREAFRRGLRELGYVAR